MTDQATKNAIIYTSLAAVVAVSGYLTYSYFRDDAEDTPPADDPVEVPVEDPKDKVKPDENNGKEAGGNVPTLPEIPDTPELTPEQEAENLGMQLKFDDPKELIEHLAAKLQKVKGEEDLKDIARILGNGKADPVVMDKLKKLFANEQIKLKGEDWIEMVGEIKIGRKSRWNLYLENGSVMQVEIEKKNDGNWKFDKVDLPELAIDENGNKLTPEQVRERQLAKDAKDAINFSHNFLKSLEVQDFEKARKMVDSTQISDAKIAGLCILFEDGNYKLNDKKPLQKIRLKDQIGSFYVNLKAGSTSDDARFSVITKRAKVDDPWTIKELNLDSLLEDYAKRVAGGDVYYTPLIKNPDGGDTIVIYFEFDSEGVTERTQNQLKIVARILSLDAKNKVTLSGHTDAVCSNVYNEKLSKKRAFSVKDYLVKLGVKPDQIRTEAHGFTKPRRPDTAQDGTDDPNARRANRRTEIYLDF